MAAGRSLVEILTFDILSVPDHVFQYMFVEVRRKNVLEYEAQVCRVVFSPVANFSRFKQLTLQTALGNNEKNMFLESYLLQHGRRSMAEEQNSCPQLKAQRHICLRNRLKLQKNARGSGTLGKTNEEVI